MIKKYATAHIYLSEVMVFISIIFLLGSCNDPENSSQANTFIKFSESQNLAADFKNPPYSAKPWAFWWWLEGNISREGIVHDLKAMKKVGIGGAIIYDAGSSSYNDVKRTAPGPPFMSAQSKELFAYAAKVADSLKLGLSMNITSGWNDGGPWVTPKMAAKRITWSLETVKGPAKIDKKLTLPDDLLHDPNSSKPPYYEPVAVLAVKQNPSGKNIPPLKNFDLKAVHRLTHQKYPEKGGYDWNKYLEEDTLTADQGYGAQMKDVINITDKMDSTGHISWEAPQGTYDIYRFVSTGTGAQVSTHSPGGGGLAIDYMDADAMDLQFNHTIGQILPMVKSHIGSGLRYLHDDSWELGMANWSTDFVSKFKHQHGYDPTSYLPILTGKIIQSRDVSNRFLYDYRRTIADLIAQNHYGRFKELAHKNGLGIHPEGGGPHPAPIDGLKNLGINDIPMGEFWAKVKTHRVGDYERIFVKQSASAAHIYGKRLVQAEGPTSIGPQWEVDPQLLKPTIDRAFCEGLNRLVFHTFTHSPKSAGKPGVEYFAGTHFNPNITWWDEAPAYVDYITHTQFLLQQGKFVGDVLYYYGDNVPNQVPLKRVQPGPKIPDGYDYDVTDTEVILNRMSAKNHQIYLPDGMHYEVLMLPARKAIPLDVLKKIQQLVKNGATIVGPRPSSIPALKNYKKADAEVKSIAQKMWGNIGGTNVTEHAYGEGKVIWGKSLKNILSEKGITPDFVYQGDSDSTFIDFIHRTTDKAEIYFLANREGQSADFNASFRVKNKTPELWAPETAEEIPQKIFTLKNGQVNLPIHLGPYESIFVVFRNVASDQHFASVSLNRKNIYPDDLTSYHLLPHATKSGAFQFSTSGNYKFTLADGATKSVNVDAIPSPHNINDSWTVRFDTAWGGPDSVQFDTLKSWTEHKNPGIKYYSGTAVYRHKFRMKSKVLASNYRVKLDLGMVYNLAEVLVNRKKIATLWNKPFSVDITNQLQKGVNSLEIKVVNLWPNRIIGDQFLQKDKRFTHTNVTKFTKDYPLLTSGLLGPVTLSFSRVQEVNK